MFTRYIQLKYVPTNQCSIIELLRTGCKELSLYAYSPELDVYRGSIRQLEYLAFFSCYHDSLSVSGVYKVTATVTAYSIQTPGASTGPPGPITPPQFKHANIFELHQSLYIHIKHITLSSNHSIGFSGLSRPLIVSNPSNTFACLICNFFPGLLVSASAGFHSPGCHCILKNLDLKQSRI